ncbi:type IX secretion system sortase PorU [Porphyromonas crevioricanis]|uniref:Peptidase family C25 n=1 Tax=Porphyromonas crevioricanis TaxID=393921 RepID=A0A2X4PLD6_9PORP|nr:type IX secretion system sortase PorU [Porphyromonas crevioricanis]GAD07806.1 hypothetical protein PORCAN_1434 [Porphyromonas crevioricanis JCM 13913]SQH73175.1 Peptidase family C25 [Porphyromonas crevioricanis]
MTVHRYHHLLSLLCLSLLCTVGFISSPRVQAQSFPPPSSEALPLAAQTSVMNSGHWVKVDVTESGVYCITDEELRRAGFKDPEKVGVYGYGGAMLPEDLRRIKATDLPAQPSLREGNALYFYSPGTTTWYYDGKTKRYQHTTNIYSSSGYYLLSDAADPVRIQEKTPSEAAQGEERSTIAVLLHEEDRTSLAFSGRKLWGESFAFRTDYQFEEILPPHATGDIRAKLRYVSRRSTEGKMTMSLNNRHVIEDIQTRIDPNNERFSSYVRGYDCIAYSKDAVQPTSEKLWVELKYSRTGQSVYLDYYELNIDGQLRLSPGKQLPMYQLPRPEKKGQALRYMIDGADSETRVFSTSEIGNPYLCPLRPYNGTYGFVDEAPGDRGATYIAFRLSDARKVQITGPVANQNLRGETWPDLIIITPTGLKPEAERLAEYHRSADGMRVVVATDEQVYNEFTGGTPDATAYRLLAKTYYDRYLIENSTSEKPCPIQLLLFGDGSYDNRMVTTDWKQYRSKGYNFLLTYQSENSLNLDSYTADSYFTALNANESNKPIGAQKYTIGVGRIPVRTLAEAHTVVTKTIRYAEDRKPGQWKTRAIFVADNQDGFSHFRQSNRIADGLQELNPSLIVDKVLMDMYKLVSVNGKTTVPDATRKLMDVLNKGALLINYNGHGGPQGWADEQLLTLQMIKNFKYKNLPIWITATCDFCNFDHFSTSAGEEVLFNEQSGAPALFTTSRVVLDVPNFELNQALTGRLFKQTLNKRSYRLGSVLSQAKNPNEYVSPSDTINKLSFFLIGDPALSLRLPTHQIRVKKINGLASGGKDLIPLRAMQSVVIEGEVTESGGDNLDEQYNGKLYVSIFDSRQELTTFPDKSGKTQTIQDYPSVIYAGLAEVVNGRFECRFVVPKDLIYTGTEGRANFYCYDEKRGLEATGYDKSFFIDHGLAQDVEDKEPPVIEHCYLGVEKFRSGDKVNESPLFVAKLFDKSGINHSGLGPGHSISLSIHGATTAVHELNSYFTPSSLESGKGEVAFVLPTLNEGDHTATFTVWDIFNNVTTYDFAFRVVPGLSPVDVATTVRPNPVRSDQVNIAIQTNQPSVELQCYAELYDFTGRVVQRTPQTTISSQPDAPAILTFSIDPGLIDGLYLYRIFIGHNNDQMNHSEGKLLLQRQ